MGDRTTTFDTCPKCGEDTLECHEALSSCLKVDTCENPKCDYIQRYEVDDTKPPYVTIYKLDENNKRIDEEKAEPQPSVREMVASLSVFVIEEFGDLSNQIKELINRLDNPKKGTKNADKRQNPTSKDN